MVSKEVPVSSKKGSVILVSDTVSSLGAIASSHRRKFRIPVIAVTGSNGKTTTKEMIAHLLSKLGPVLKNEGTKNNHIGVPLTLLRLEPHHRFAVLELGMSGKGEIGTLSRMAAPTTGVITNIGPAHLGSLNDLETVFACKMEIVEGLKKRGNLVLNREDPYLKEVTSSYHCIVFFGKGSSFESSQLEEKGDHLSFRLNGGPEGTLPLLGSHNVENALAAVATATLHRMMPSSSLSRFKDFKGPEGRMTLRRIQEIDFIDDTYNANPESTRRALETFRTLPTKGKRIFVLGDMLELGEGSENYHAALGEKVASSSIALFVTVGGHSRSALEKARSCGMPEEQLAHFGSPLAAAEFLVAKVKPGDRVLVKGSRGMKMEEVLRGFETFKGSEYAVSPTHSS